MPDEIGRIHPASFPIVPRSERGRRFRGEVPPKHEDKERSGHDPDEPGTSDDPDDVSSVPHRIDVRI